MTKITAHAGCENTAPGSREGIETAISLGADVVEIDLRLLDGRIWLSHDLPDTARMHTYLTLERALEVLRGSRAEINCDLKDEEAFPHALKIIRRMNLESRVIFTGEFRPGFLCDGDRYRYFQNAEYLFGMDPGRKLSQADAEHLVAYYRSNGSKFFGGYNISYKTLTPQTLQTLSRAGVPLSCWTVDEEHSIDFFLRENIAYLTTDQVKYAVRQRAVLQSFV